MSKPSSDLQYLTALGNVCVPRGCVSTVQKVCECVCDRGYEEAVNVSVYVMDKTASCCLIKDGQMWEKGKYH